MSTGKLDTGAIVGNWFTGETKKHAMWDAEARHHAYEEGVKAGIAAVMTWMQEADIALTNSQRRDMRWMDFYLPPNPYKDKLQETARAYNQFQKDVRA